MHNIIFQLLSMYTCHKMNLVPNVCCLFWRIARFLQKNDEFHGFFFISKFLEVPQLSRPSISINLNGCICLSESSGFFAWITFVENTTSTVLIPTISLMKLVRAFFKYLNMSKVACSAGRCFFNRAKPIGLEESASLVEAYSRLPPLFKPVTADDLSHYLILLFTGLLIIRALNHKTGMRHR